MRPSEIDHTSRKKHYFDVSCGEVLARQDDYKAYVATHPDPKHVVSLSDLLRISDIDLSEDQYEPLDCSTWTEDQYRQYGRWILNHTPPPENTSRYRRINKEVFDQAHKLGIGPSSWEIICAYDGLSRFYKAIGAKNVHVKRQFDDWAIDDFISYLKSVGGDTRPEFEEINHLSRLDPSKPSWKVIHDRFKDIGGFRKIQEMAGYTVVRLWDRDDFINWGVNFMEANDGMAPTVTTLDYMSTKQRGPGAFTIYSNFDSIPSFKTEVAQRFLEKQHDKNENDESLLDTINVRLASHQLPLELFTHGVAEIHDPATALLESGNSPLELLEQKLGRSELLIRYGKFAVASEVAPGISEEVKISIACDEGPERGFEASIRKHHKVPHGDIEYAGLTLDVFDYLWPLDEHMDSLKLDDNFESYKRKIWDAKNKYRRKKTQAKQAEMIT